VWNAFTLIKISLSLRDGRNKFPPFPDLLGGNYFRVALDFPDYE
jgi:hypothetical protein